MGCLFSNKGSWRQTGRRALPSRSLLWLSPQSQAVICAEEGRLEGVYPAQPLQRPGIRGQGVGRSAGFPRAGQLLKLHWGTSDTCVSMGTGQRGL